MGMTCHEHQYDGPNACTYCVENIVFKIDKMELTPKDYPLLKELLSWA